MHLKHALFSAALLSSLAVPCLADTDNSAAEDTRGVEQAVNQFYASLNQLFAGQLAPMEQVWSHADDVTYMGPVGGFQVGWEQVRLNWATQADLKLGGAVEPANLRITVGNNLAVVECYEVGNNVSPSGQPQQVSIRATSQFRKENGEWKMIGHHTDTLPYLQNESRRNAR